MSNNMIKGYSVSYDTKKIRVLDTEDREQLIEQRIQEILPFRPMLSQPEEEAEESGFIPGLIAEDLSDVIPQEPEEMPVPEIDLEAVKESLREEITNEIAAQYQEKAEAILAEARAKAEEIVSSAESDAQTAKESILKIASAQGYEEGLKRAKEEEDRALKALSEKEIQLTNEYERQVSELEPAFVQILKELLVKITGVTYKYHDEVLLYLLDSGFDTSKKQTAFEVCLSEEDYDRFEAQFPEIQEKYSEKLSLTFRRDETLSSGSCKLENENCSIDCGIDISLKGVLENLEMLG